MTRSLLLLLAALALASVLKAQVAPVAPPSPAALPAAPAIQVEQMLRPPEPGRFAELFRRFRTEHAALSPDGKYLAYSVREDDTLSVVVVEIDHPEKIKARVQVINDDAATPMLAAVQREKTPGRIKWMGWTSPTRVVVETNHAFTRTTGADSIWQSWQGAVFGFDADGSNARILASPEDLPEFAEEARSTSPFSTSRSGSTGFDSRVTTPDEPTPVAGQTEPVPGTGTPAPGTDDEAATPPPANIGARQPRSLRVFDFDPQRPGAVTLIATGALRSTGSRSLSLHSLDAQTGQLTDLTFDLAPSFRDAALDRQGRIRLTLPNSLLSSYPFHYAYLGPKGRNRPQPLDEATGLSGFSVAPDTFFGPRAIPLGFDENPDVLYYAANTGRDTYGIYSFDLATKKRGSLAMENPAYDLIGPPAASFPDQRSLVFDRFRHQLIGVRYDNALRTTAWLRPEWRAMQAEFEKMFPGRSVGITGWDEAARRFLVTTEGPADPGAFFIYDREKNKLLEFVRRAPWIDAHHPHLTLPFSYATNDGARISGLVTVPEQPRLKPIPMVVLCPDLPWQRVRSDFQTEVQVLAAMGFVVVQLNGRGAWGLGLAQRQALTAGYDLVQIDDIVTAMANLEKIFAVNPARVALVGRGHGGFIALRALQAHPDKFRCAVALEAPVNLAGWLAEQKWSGDDVQPQLTRAWLGDKERLKAAPLVSHPEAVTKPILLLNYPGLDGEPRKPSYLAARNFAASVRRHGTTVEFDELHLDYLNGLPAARAAVFDRIEQFLNVNVYDYQVKLHELKVIK